jgi:hypothetical protein
VKSIFVPVTFAVMPFGIVVPYPAGGPASSARTAGSAPAGRLRST